MDGYALLGILAIVYAGAVFFITFKKPKAIWSMGKIRAFEKALGEKGTIIFFYAFGLFAAVLGIWLLMR